jgi:serine/threonine-protein kinase HSL1 (negative regulator of Swe1 kinase)
MTVVEHGSRSHLSIARFIQEKGSASSFNKVVQTLEAVLSHKDILVTDKVKREMMVKTLKAAIAASA